MSSFDRVFPSCAPDVFVIAARNYPAKAMGVRLCVGSPCDNKTFISPDKSSYDSALLGQPAQR
jgi:hypothetical protein